MMYTYAVDCKRTVMVIAKSERDAMSLVGNDAMRARRVRLWDKVTE